ncbi:MAG: choice-of-anchor L domain-containing protein, partial [Bacteroidota bacterium]
MNQLYSVLYRIWLGKVSGKKAIAAVKPLVTAFILISFGHTIKAQTFSTVNANAQALTQLLAGPGVTISNYVISGGSPLQSGTFTYSGSNLGMVGGGVLTTGKIQDASGAATTTASRSYANTGDAQLATLTSGTIYDPIILEFDLIPQGPLLTFDYAFASEEYPEWVCNANSDVFGIFVTGPNPAGGTYSSNNVAVITNTTKPVGINSINPGSAGASAGGGTCGAANQSLAYSSLYTNNLSPVDPDIVFDGMTKVLRASVAVTPCQTYHFKIAIADVGTRINDSGLFLSAYSFTTTPVSVSAVAQLDYAGFSSAYEGCVGGTFTMGLSQVQTVDVYINLSVTGTATNGSDYTAIPTTVMIPAGQTSVSIDIDPIADGISEAAETVTISPLNPCSGAALSSATITIRDDIAAAITVADSTLCSGQSTQLTAVGGLSYSWSPTTGLSNANISNPVATPTTTTTYTCSMTWGACAKTATATVRISTPTLSTSATPAGTVCNGGTVVLTATPASGVSPYSYLWSNGGTSPSITIATGGTYTVTTTDSYGCTANSSRAVTISNLSVSGTSTNVSCIGGNNGAIDITVTGSNAPFTYNWGGGIASQDRTNLVTGTYNVTASNTVGCSVTATYTITQPAAALTTSASTTAVTCNGGNNGSINLTANGGVSPYSYVWNNAATTQDLNNLTAGSYLVTVTDFNGCTASRASNITQPTAIATSETHVNESCFGQSTGSINLTVSGGTGAYSYIWSNSAVVQDISLLAAGTYTVTVSDANSCTASRSVAITEPSVISPVLTATNPSCFGGSNGSITTATTGGTSPYTYAWGHGPVSQNISSLSAATFIVTVTDNNSCTATETATLSEPAALSASAAQTNVSCNGGNNGNISLTVSGGTSPYTYNWGGGITTQNRTSLTTGIYNVTSADNNGCTATASATISQPAALSVSNASTNVSCNAGNNGSIDITVSGGTSPYTYNWGGGITTQDRSGLPAGTYNVTATDVTACSVSAAVIVTQPASLSFSETHVNSTCNEGSDGSINITISGGTAPYTYNWGGGITSQNRISLSAGTYTLTSTDSKSCSVTGAAVISQPTAVNISASVTDASCAPGNNGAISLTVSGGSSPYTYNWGGGITTQNRTTLFAGTYNVTVTDNIGCSTANAIAVSQIGTGMSLSASKTNVSCNGGNNGAIDIALAGGSAPITYNWGGGITTQDRTSLTAGNYSVTVTDGLGCSAISSNIITEPTAISLSANTTNILCSGANTGNITLTVSGGVSAYTYNWGGGITSQNRAGITAGTYTVTITDANLCTATSSSIITQPLSAISLSTSVSNVSCYGENTGSVNLTVSGGTSGYTFIWNNGNISQNLSSISSGTYNVTVTDANACTASVSSAVTQPAAALSVSLATTNLSCNAISTGAIVTIVTGGTSAYGFSWDDASILQNRSALAAGNYSLTVTDNNSCSATATTVITEPTAIQINANSTDITCNGLNNGSITLSTTGGISPYSYNWGGGITTQNRTSLASSTYIVTVTDANLCTATSSTTIAEPTALILTINSGASICLSPTGTASAEAGSTGTAPYTYLWANSNTSQNLTALAPGPVSVTVTDYNGCSASSSSAVVLSGNNTDATFSVAGSYCGPGNTLTFTHTGSGSIINHYWDFGNSTGTSTQNNPAYTYPAVGSFSVTHIVYRGYCSDTVTSPFTIFQKPILSSVNTNITCNGLNNGTIDLSVTGYPAFTYNWGGGIVTQDRSSLAVGTYVVTVTDVNACSSSLSASITQPNVLTVTNTNINVSCNGGSNGAINLTVVGGTSGYSYNWGGGITTQNRTSLSGGTYNVTVTDANACSSVNAISLYQPNALSLATAVTNVACNGQGNGAINLTVTGGTGAYTYNWGGGILSQNRTSLSAATYNVSVTDGNACSATTSATITQPSVLTTSLSPSSVSCFGGNNGSITSSITGGTSPFNYTWNDGDINSNRSNLSMGTYAVTILDQNSCSVSAFSAVTQPSTAVSVVVNSTSTISCYGDSTGTINITATGGVPGYTYLWSDNRTFEDRTNMLGGTYFVSVTDLNGCSITSSATINQPSAPLIIDTIVAVNVLCYGSATGSLTTTISGGTTPYSYSWNGGATSANKTNILAGVYTLTATDFKGCTTTATATITQPTAALSTTVSVTNVACFSNSTGAISLTTTGGTGAYSYNWSGGITTQNRTNIPAGTYSVTITDANSCSTSLSRTITQPTAALNALTSVTNVACFSNSTGAISLTTTGGTGAYSYNWSGGITTQN